MKLNFSKIESVPTKKVPTMKWSVSKIAPSNKVERNQMKMKLTWMFRTCPSNLLNKETLVADFYDLPDDQPVVQKASSPERSTRMQEKTQRLLENMQFSDDSPERPNLSASPIVRRSFGLEKANLQPRVILKELNSLSNEVSDPTVDLNTRINADKVWFYHDNVVK